MYRVVTSMGALAFGTMAVLLTQAVICSPVNIATCSAIPGALIAADSWIGLPALGLSLGAVILAIIHALATRRMVALVGLCMLLPVCEFAVLVSIDAHVSASSVIASLLPSLGVCVYGVYCWVGYRRALPQQMR